jgi:hypothetical protein
VQGLGGGQGVRLGDAGEVVGLEDAATDETLRELHAGLGGGERRARGEGLGG